MWTLFNRKRRDQELDEEIRAHLTMAIRDRIERGEDPQAAELSARREFGNRSLIQETTRDIWGWSSLEALWLDTRYALRGLRRSPGFATVAILSLALGIGANTAIFSLMYTVMLRTLPVDHPEELVELLQKYPGEPRGGYWTHNSYEHFRDHNHVFSALTGTSINTRSSLRAGGSERGPATSEHVLGNYFRVLGLRAAMGRLIGPEDDAVGPAVAVVSWSCWKNRFHGEPGILGKQIFVDDVPAAIIGVAPPAFSGLQPGAATDIWLPRKDAPMALLGRLKPGTTVEQARAEVAVLYRFTIEERAAKSKDPLVRQLKVEVEPAGAGFSALRDVYGKPLAALMTVVGLLLLLACINIAGILLARGAGRRREIAVRVGLGAGRGRLVRQMLTESLLLSAAGTLVGVVVAYFGTNALVRIIGSGQAHERIQIDVRPDLYVLLFTAGVAVLSALLFGLIPAWSAWKLEPASALREAARAGDTRLRRLFGQSLVVAQLALSVLLLSAAGLFISHMSNLRNVDYLGFRRDHVLLMVLDTARSGYQRPELARLSQDLLQQLESIPAVRSATISAATPIQGAGASRFITAEGHQERPEDRRYVALNWVAPKNFETLGVPLLAGRDFQFEDQNRQRVAIINRAMERHYFAGRNPIGKHLRLDGNERPYEIIGVVGDAKYTELHDAPPRTMYLNIFQEGPRFSQYALRTSVPPGLLTGDVRHAVQDVLKTVPITRITTLSDQVDAAMVPERLIAALSGYFGVLGAVLAGIGLYGLLAYTVTRRINEIGLRMALGATSGDVTRMVLRDALAMCGAGLLLGAPLAFWGRSLITAVIPDLTVKSAMPLAVGAVLILGVALAASYLPACRAARVDPVEALRHE